jgi:DNA-binding transcriptional LysR family regulator
MVGFLQKSGLQRLMNTLTNLDLRQVRYAVTLADELHFGRAAARLDISQQTLSAQIRQLEKNIGTVLFIRDRRHVEVTWAGSVFVATGRMLLTEADDMLTEIAQHTDRLRVDVEMESLETPMLISEEVFGAVDDMLPEIREGHGFAAALPNLLAGEIDVTFGWLAPGERLPRGIARTLVRRQPINILLPRRHPLASAQETRLTDLRRFPVLVYAAREAVAWRAWQKELISTFGLQLGTRVDMHGQRAITRAVLATGHPAVTRLVSAPSSELTLRPLVDPVPVLNWSMLWRSSDQARIDPFLAKLENFLAERGWLDLPARWWWSPDEKAHPIGG